jgi:hypothetical protein
MDREIEDIWQDKAFKAARIMLYAGKRTFVPCYGCNALSHRVGLLPDLKGKQEMPEITKKTEEFVDTYALYEKPLCGDDWHKRKWEE